MNDNQLITASGRGGNPSMGAASDAPAGLDDVVIDEPLASGQRKRYLASLRPVGSRA